VSESPKKLDWQTGLDWGRILPALTQHLDSYVKGYVDPERGTIYNGVTDYAPHFPTEAECLAEIPNSQGWFTAIEDNTLLSSWILWALARGVTGLDPKTRASVGRHVFKGATLLWSIPGNGFVARGLVPNSNAFFQNSSLEQLPNHLRGIWAWAKSDLATEADRALAAEIFRSVLARLDRFDWILPRFDGQPGTGSGSTSNIRGLGPLQVPQYLTYFLMAYDLTGEGRFLDQYRQARDEDGARRLALLASDNYPNWHGYRMSIFSQCVTVIAQLDPEPATQKACRAGLERMGVLGSNLFWHYPVGLPLDRPAAPLRRYDWRGAHRRCLEMGLDLRERRNQVLQGRMIAEMSARDPDAPPVDGRERLVGYLFALEAICLAGLPWLARTEASPAVDVDLKEHYWRVLYDIVDKSAPEVPWQWGFNALLSLASAATGDGLACSSRRENGFSRNT
jgi:hypothetical protein